MPKDKDYLNDGLKQEELGHLSQAIDLYDKALTENPGMVQAWIHKARIYFLKKEFQIALENVNEAIRIEPKTSELYKIKARILSGLGEIKDSLSNYMIALEKNPDDDEIWIDIGIMNYIAKNYDKSLECFDNALKINPNTFLSNYWKGKTLVSQKELEKAIKFFENALAINPKEYRIWIEKSTLFLDLKRYPEVIKSINEALNIKPQSTEALSLKGYAYLLDNRYEKAIQAYDKALALDPKLNDVIINRKEALRKLSEKENPIDDLIKTLETEPKNYMEWYNQSQKLTKIMNLKDALKSIEESIKLNPGFAEAWMQKGLIHSASVEFEDSVEAYDEAIRLNPHFPNAFSNRATSLIYLKRYKDSIKSADEAIKLDPLYSEPWLSKAGALNYLGNYKKALKVINEGIKIAEKVGTSSSFLALYFNTKAIILRNAGKIKESEKLKKKAKQLNPQLYSSKERVQVIGDLPKDFESKIEKLSEDFRKKYSGLVHEGIELSNKGKFKEALKKYDTALKIYSKEPKVWANKGVVLMNQHKYEEALTCLNTAIELDPKFEDFWGIKVEILMSLGKKDEVLKILDEALRVNPHFNKISKFRESLMRQPKKILDIERFKQENCDIFFDGKKGVVVLRNIGHAILQFSDSKGNKSDYIKIRYTGQPEIVIQEMEVLYNTAISQNQIDNLSWITKEYFKLFDRFDYLDSPITTDRNIDPMLPEYEYSLKMGKEKWEFSYIRNDNRERLFKLMKINPILIDYFNGVIIQDKDHNWQEYGTKKKISLKIQYDLPLLNNHLTEDKMFTVYSMMVTMTAFMSYLQSKDSKVLQDHRQKIAGISRDFPQIISYNERYEKFFQDFFREYYKR